MSKLKTVEVREDIYGRPIRNSAGEEMSVSIEATDKYLPSDLTAIQRYDREYPVERRFGVSDIQVLPLHSVLSIGKTLVVGVDSNWCSCWLHVDECLQYSGRSAEK